MFTLRTFGETRRSNAMNTVSASARASLSACVICLIGLAGKSQVHATEIRLLSAAAMQSVFKQVAGEYERTSGYKLIIDYATMGAINDRVLRGETADLIISSSQSISNLVKQGRIDAKSQLPICK